MSSNRYHQQFLASVSSSTVFGSAHIMLAPPPRRYTGPQQPTIAASRQGARVGSARLCSNTSHRNASLESLAQSERSQDTLVECSDVLLVKQDCKSISLCSEPLAARPCLDAGDKRAQEIENSWMQHTGLDINDVRRNGPKPGCTVEELNAAVDDFFGCPKRSKSRPAKAKDDKAASAGQGTANSTAKTVPLGDASSDERRAKKGSKAKLIRKVRSLHWMA
ncbi:unnamed protein product [Parajaminaea phylloscopi]